MDDPIKYKDPDARRIIFTYDDLRARCFLVDSAEKEYALGNKLGCSVLFHAEMYLADRVSYESGPPTDKLAIPLPQRSPARRRDW
jgi:hypothetical protein